MQKELLTEIELKHKRYLAYLQGITAISLALAVAHFSRPQTFFSIGNFQIGLIQVSLAVIISGWLSLHLSLRTSENRLLAKA
ncbi:MAG: hypothetical protein AABX01_04025 [Candidatus Micrarchaeota archaeon]